jgi:UDPglucose--hexose-1-phosphate uridylyltransferase
VIVESPDHEARFHDVPHARDLLRLYVRRYRVHGSAPYVALFKNEGTAAGSSITHVHSQLVPVPFVPARIAQERDAFLRAAHCPLCREFENVIAETSCFRWVTPFDSRMPYQQWIVPRRHVSDLTAFTDEEIDELATLLRDASAATTRIAPAFNWAFINFPRAVSAHAYVDVLPRLTTIAGFELGTGTFVEIVDPARAAETLRS